MHSMSNMAGMDSISHDMGSMDFGGIPESRDASGTSWQPDETPMHAHHMMLDDWAVMTHYNAFLGYDHQSGRRGDSQFDSTNWFMLMATKQTTTDQISLRGMFSIEPWTTTARGYPLLFQSGEAYRGQPLVDRQHPHDLFMELAVRYRHVLDDNTVLSLYLAPSGEPALGPTAFPHRMSAMDNPAAPISHHWFDSTHISFGVLTAGIVRKTWQVEGSVFNGREPNEHRWDIDPIKLDSYSTRLSWNPDPEWSGQVSVGYLKSPEQLHPDEHVRRYTASLTHVKTLGSMAHIAETFGWGLNDTSGEKSTAVFAEASWTQNMFTVFGRAEYVQKTGEELNLTPSRAKWGVKQLTFGASHELITGKPYEVALGASATYTFAPDELDRLYGDHPVGYWIFLRVRPGPMTMK